MKPFLISKRKTFELTVLLALDAVFFFLWKSWDFVILFSLGYIWNWVATQDLSALFENRRYRFSTLKTIVNLQHLVQRPFQKWPGVFKLIARSLPAGIFWSAVIFFNESPMPWWAVFIGSITLELVQLEPKMFRVEKEPSP